MNKRVSILIQNKVNGCKINVSFGTKNKRSNLNELPVSNKTKKNRKNVIVRV